MAKKSDYPKTPEGASNRARSSMIGATSATRLSLPSAPPSPTSPDLAKYMNDAKTARAANATPEQQMRSADTKRVLLNSLSEEENKKKGGKKNALKKALKKFTGKGRPMGLPGGDLKNLRR